LPVSVEIQDERGNREGAAWWHARSSAILVDDHPGTCCLRFIDPYGDTTFNQSQLLVLVHELQDLRNRAGTSTDVEALDDLLRFLQSAVGRVHTYVKFVGD
jgi:hypothetical protein